MTVVVLKASGVHHPFRGAPAPAPAAGCAYPTRALALPSGHPRPAAPQNPLVGRPEPSSRAVAAREGNFHENLQGKSRVFFLDVNPLCYNGNQPSLHSFASWISLFFSQVSVRCPIIAVLDGEEGNEYRRRLLPSYKAHRRRALRRPRGCDGIPSSAEMQVVDVLQKCNVPVIKVNGYEADDVVATLTDQVLRKGYRVVIGSPDKDFKQLISEDVQIVMPMPEFERWSFYTLRHYTAQYNCDPSSDLSLRCIMGDEVDGVPGIQHLAPGFGRRTAVKLLKKHGSLENLLSAAAIRTVGKHYAQDALTKYADYLRKNYEVLRLRRDAYIHLKEEWLLERETCNDTSVLSGFVNKLGKAWKQDNRGRMMMRTPMQKGMLM